MNTFDIFIQIHKGEFSIDTAGLINTVAPSASFPSLAQILTPAQQAILPRIADKEASATTDEIRAVGQALYTALFTPAIAMAYGEAKGRSDGNVRLRLQIEPPELLALPWEAMHDGTDWLATRSDTPLVRRLAGMEEAAFPEKLGIRAAMRILFIGAAPEGVAHIDLDAVADELRARLAKPIEEGIVDLTILLNASLEKDIRPVLTQNEGRSAKPYHIVYFLCHGRNDAICLDDGYGDSIDGEQDKKRTPGEPNWVTAETLVREFQNEKLRIIFLSACETGGQPDQSSGVMQSFAQELALGLDLPAIVAMQYFVSGMQAATLSAEFFAHLAAFEPVDVALAAARAALISQDEVRRDVLAPVIYLQTDSAELFAKARNWWAIGLLGMLPILMLLAIFLGRFWINNNDQRLLQEAVQLASKAKEQIHPADPLLGLQIALEAREMTPNSQHQSEGFQFIEKVIRDMMTTGRVVALPSPQNVNAIQFVPGSPLLLIGRTTDSSQLFDLQNKVFRSLPAQLAQTLAVAQPSSFFIVDYYDDKPSELRRITDGMLLETLSADIRSIEASPFSSIPFFLVQYFDTAEWRDKQDGSLLQEVASVEKAIFSRGVDWPLFVMQPDEPAPYPAEVRSGLRRDFILPLQERVRDVFYSPSITYPLMIVDYYSDKRAEVRSARTGEHLETLTDDIYELYFSPQHAASIFIVSYLEEVTARNDEIRSLVDGTLVDELSGGISKVNYSQDPDARIFILDYGVLAQRSEVRQVEDGRLLEQLPYHVYRAEAATLGDASVFLVSYYERFDEKPRVGEILSTQDGTQLGTLRDSLFTAYTSPHKSASIAIIDYMTEIPDEILIQPTTAIPLRHDLSHVFISSGEVAPYFVVAFEDSTGAVISASDGAILTELKGNIVDVKFGIAAGKSFFVIHYDNKSEIWSMEPLPHKLVDLNSAVAEVTWNDLHLAAAVRYEGGYAYILDLAWLEQQFNAANDPEWLNLACYPFTSHRIDEESIKQIVPNSTGQICGKLDERAITR